MGLLKEAWLTETTSYDSLTDYVSKMCFRLQRACQLAQENLGVSQERMKKQYDRKAVSRHFTPGDQVMVLLPVPGSTLQAHYAGPYRVERRVDDLNYAIATPDRRKNSRLCHINMLKLYHARQPMSSSPSAAVPTSSVKAELSTQFSAEVAAAVSPCDVALVSDPPTPVKFPLLIIFVGFVTVPISVKEMKALTKVLSGRLRCLVTHYLSNH